MSVVLVCSAGWRWTLDGKIKNAICSLKYESDGAATHEIIKNVQMENEFVLVGFLLFAVLLRNVL